MAPPDTLVLMANQIARALAHEGEERAIACVRVHLVKFWAPATRSEICAYLAQVGEALLPGARGTAESLPATAWRYVEDRSTGG